jgi:hypothetical protein
MVYNISICMQENFFEIINDETKAYILGFLYADGCFTSKNNRINVNLSVKDSDLLKHMSIVLLGEDKTKIDTKQYTSYIKNRPIKSKGFIRLQIYNKKMVNDLIKTGNESPKSLTLTFPLNLDSSLYNHFIRGYFDGDGCLSIKSNSKNNVKRATIAILSSFSFCDKLKDIIENLLNITTNIIKKGKIHVLEINGNKQVEIFTDWMYKDCTIKLERKYEKYLELKKLRIKATKYYSESSSKYKNITYDKTRNKWIACCRLPLEKRTKHIGRFETEEQAYVAQQEYLRNISI